MKTVSPQQENLRKEVENLLVKTLPSKAHVFVKNTFSCLGNDEQLKIVLAVSDHEINNVRGQYVQDVSLLYNITNSELTVQIFGGNGGQSIYRTPPEGSYLAMERIRIPFRKPKSEKKFIMKAIERFAQNWVKAIKENKSVLMYQNLVNYDEFIKS